MSEIRTPSILALPVELYHQIFDYLDARTILRSIRCVCSLFRLATSSYPRYRLDFRCITKNDFHHLCALVRPENVISLYLSDDEETPGEIDLFLSNVNLHQFVRLRSVALQLTDDTHLDEILTHLLSCSLTSLSINRPRTRTHRQNTYHLLGAILAKNTLRRFQGTIDFFSTDQFHWPRQCAVKHLTIDYCVQTDFCLFLDHLPNLQSMTISHGNIDGELVDNHSSRQYFQITSLTIKRLFLSFDQLETFLHLTPSLTHLQLEGSADDQIFDSDRWEKFIRTKLLFLTNFQFCFRSQNARLIERCTQLEFHTPFWLVDILYDTAREELLVCSAPDSVREIEYRFMGPVLVRRANGDTTTATISSERLTPVIFHRIIELEVSEDVLDSWKYMSTVVDLSHVKKLRIMLYDGQNFESIIKEKLIDLLKGTSHLRSLEILFEFVLKIDLSFLERICSIIPDQIKHLNIEARTWSDVDFILE